MHIKRLRYAGSLERHRAPILQYPWVSPATLPTFLLPKGPKGLAVSAPSIHTPRPSEVCTCLSAPSANRQVIPSGERHWPRLPHEQEGTGIGHPGGEEEEGVFSQVCLSLGAEGYRLSERLPLLGPRLQEFLQPGSKWVRQGPLAQRRACGSESAQPGLGL